ncbi:4233_t:CDS:2 [Rhizophagus irregularis]|nr:4233_t:CDS:2 [Rhizophagus irregularis]
MANTILNPRDPHNAHDGKQVSLVSLSLNGKYAVTYSEDDKSIEGWIVENSEPILDHEANVYKLPKEWTYIYEIKVNDSKIVCYSSYDNIEIFQMSTEHQQIELNPPPESLVEYKINFKKEGNLVIFNNDKISIYHSKHDMSNELSLMSSYELSSCNKLITGKLIDYIKKVINGVFIDDDNIWVISPHYLFHWDLETFQLKFSYSLGFTAKYYEHGKLTVLTKGNSIAVKYMDYEINEIAIFLKDVHFPIRNIQLKDTDTKIEFCEVQNNDYLLAFNLPRKDEKQNIILYNITDINAQPKDASMIFNENKFILYEYNSESKKAFGLVDGKFSYINLLDLNWHEFFESHKEDDDLVGWNDYLCQTFKKYYYNDTLAFPDMENIRSLLSESKNMKEVSSLPSLRG